MSANNSVSQIYDQLASARCVQDLDNELSNISQQHWHLFVDYMCSLIKDTEEYEPQRAQALRSLLHSWLERWQCKKN